MSEDSTPLSQAPPSGAKEGSGGGRRPSQNNRVSKKSTPTPRPSSTGPNQNGSVTPNNSSGGGLKPSRSASNTRKSSVNSPQTGPAARLAAGDAISRPSSTDTSGARNNSESGGGRREGRQRQVSRSAGQGGTGTKKAQGGNNNAGANSPAKSVSSGGQAPAPTPGASESGSAALSSLQRVITDLKSISPNPPSASGNVRTNSSGSSPADNNPPPRHRKSASAGAISGNFGGNFASAGYANSLGAMQEDVEDGYSYVESEEYNDQPGFSQPQQQPQQAPQGYGGAMRTMQHQPMGSFAAPRFQAQQLPHAQMQPQDAYGIQGEVIGPSGRPQLAPNFTFGASRHPRAPSSEGDDTTFQFPPQQTQLPNLPSSQYDNANAPRRANEVPAGVTGLMAEQVCSFTSD